MPYTRFDNNSLIRILPPRLRYCSIIHRLLRRFFALNAIGNHKTSCHAWRFVAWRLNEVS